MLKIVAELKSLKWSKRVPPKLNLVGWKNRPYGQQRVSVEYRSGQESVFTWTRMLKAVSHNRLHSTSAPASCSPSDPALVCEGNEVPAPDPLLLELSHEWSRAGPTGDGLAVTSLSSVRHTHTSGSLEVTSTALLSLNSQTNKQNLAVLLGRWPYMAPVRPSVCPYVTAIPVRSLMFFWPHWDVVSACWTPHRPGGDGTPRHAAGHGRKTQLKDGNGSPGGTLDSTNNRRSIWTIQPKVCGSN